MRNSTLRDRRFIGAFVGFMFVLVSPVLFATTVAFLSPVFALCGLALLALAYEAHCELPRAAGEVEVVPGAVWEVQAPISGLTRFRTAVIAVEALVLTAHVGVLWGVKYGAAAFLVSTLAALAVGVRIQRERPRVMGWMLRLELDSQRHISLRTGHFDGSRIWDLCDNYVYEDSFSGKSLFPLDQVEEILNSMGIDVLDAALRARLIQDTFESRWTAFAATAKFNA